MRPFVHFDFRHNSRYMRLCIVLCTWCLSVGALCGAQAADPFAHQRATWLADVRQPQWWLGVTLDAGDQSPIVLPPGNPTVPQATLQHAYHMSEFFHFIEYQLLNHRNGIRLLGKPTSITTDAKGLVTISWRRAVLVVVRPAVDPRLSLEIAMYGAEVTIGQNGSEFTWRAFDMQQQRLVDMKEIL